MPMKYSPSKDIPDLSGQSIFITGGTGGLGAGTALELSKHNPAHIYISGRNAKNAEKIIAEIEKSNKSTRVTFVECDLSSLSAVQNAADHFLAQTPPPRLDTLICNAGIMNRPQETSKEGYEIQFATNHLGHALLIRKLLPLLEKTASEGKDGRIVVLSSLAWQMHPLGGIQFDRLRSGQSFPILGPWQRYGQTKLANLLYARELAKRYPHLTCVSVYPGIVTTNLFDYMSFKNKVMLYGCFWWFMVRPEKGVQNQLWAATTPKKELSNGSFYNPVGKNGDSGLMRCAKDSKGVHAKRLWEWTEDALKGY